MQKKTKIDLRKPFMETLIKLAEKDDKIVFIIPDVGFSFTEEFQKKFPDRYFNFGVTEMSTMIIAAGLALAGYKPYVYSMINFVVFRPFEAVRNAIGYHSANVKLIGVSGSVKYKFLGFSHNIVPHEDSHVLKKIPNFVSFPHPTTAKEVEALVKKTYKIKKPVYIKL